MKSLPPVTAQLEALNRLEIKGETGAFIAQMVIKNLTAQQLDLVELERVRQIYQELFTETSTDKGDFE